MNDCPCNNYVVNNEFLVGKEVTCAACGRVMATGKFVRAVQEKVNEAIQKIYSRSIDEVVAE